MACGGSCMGSDSIGYGLRLDFIGAFAMPLNEASEMRRRMRLLGRALRVTGRAGAITRRWDYPRRSLQPRNGSWLVWI